jgi:hypothetical protein
MGCPNFQTKKVVASIWKSQFKVRHYLLENLLSENTREVSWRLYRGSISPILHGDHPAALCSLTHDPVLCLGALILSFSVVFFLLLREAKAHRHSSRTVKSVLVFHCRMSRTCGNGKASAVPGTSQGKSWPLHRHCRRLSDQAAKVQHGAGLRPIHWFHSYKACSGGMQEF